jgi:hypothetical protein
MSIEKRYIEILDDIKQIESSMQPNFKKINTDWKDLGTLLFYQKPGFQFCSDVIITDLEDCLINHITTGRLYNRRNQYEMTLFAKEFMEQLITDSDTKSIIIISNQISRKKLNIDAIKKKTEQFARITKLNFIGLFPLLPNCFMKPHTGCWRFLNAYFNQCGTAHIRNALVVSNEGGLIEKKTIDEKIITRSITSDIDRAFAWNIKCEFKTIDEYMNDIKPLPFAWDTYIITPDIRKIYINKIKAHKNPDIMEKLMEFGIRDVYVIMIVGAPRCGKTKFAKSLIKKWRESPLEKTKTITRLGLDKYTPRKLFNVFKKSIDDRISIILDGVCNDEHSRKPFMNFLYHKNIPVLFIEVNCGIEMAKVLNHAHLEMTSNTDEVLYGSNVYDLYKSNHSIPKESENLHYMLYVPQIEENECIMSMRY